MAPLAYYNENDPFAAAWLRELIKARLIADGEVDERDIQDVRTEDVRGFVQCHFFAGIGGWSYALRLAGWADNRPVWTGSCPCQPFSQAGRGNATADSRHLWPTWFRLIAKSKPLTVFGEQVASADGIAWFDTVSADMERADYAIGAFDLPACSIGAPHARPRLFFVADGSWSDADVRVEDRRTVVRQMGREWHPSHARETPDTQAGLWAAESKPEPVAYGLPNRMGHSNGYGNAIVPQVAAEVIKAYMESVA